MNIELKVDPKDIEKHVTDAIVASAFGEQLKGAVDDALEKLGSTYSYENELKKFVERRMYEIAIKTITEKYEEVVKQKILAAVTEEKFDEVIGAIVRRVLDVGKIKYEY